MKSLTQYILEAQSKPTVEWMKEYYDKFNKELFDNQLPSNIRLGLISNTKEKALGWQGFNHAYYYSRDYMRGDMYIMLYFDKTISYTVNRYRQTVDLSKAKHATSAEELSPFIELNPRYQFSDFQKEDTLIHEMIHLWVHRNGLGPKRAHGKEFKAKCDEIRAKAKRLYGIEYHLTTYAKKDKDEDKSYQLAKDIEGKITDEIKKAAKRGGGVYSIYAIYDVNKINNIRLVRFNHRFMFCTKNRLERVIEQVKKSEGIKEIWVSPTAYTKMSAAYGLFSTVQNYCRFWDTVQGDYDEKYLLEDAKNILNLNEGLGSKIKDWLKKIMGVFIKITKETPASEIDVEKMLDLAEEESAEDIEGTKENEDKIINIE